MNIRVSVFGASDDVDNIDPEPYKVLQYVASMMSESQSYVNVAIER